MNLLFVSLFRSTPKPILRSDDAGYHIRGINEFDFEFVYWGPMSEITHTDCYLFSGAELKDFVKSGKNFWEHTLLQNFDLTEKQAIRMALLGFSQVSVLERARFCWASQR